MFRIFHGMRRCKKLLPVMSTGGIVLRETQCLLPMDHDGPHRNAEGSVMANRAEMDRLLNGPKRGWR